MSEESPTPESSASQTPPVDPAAQQPPPVQPAPQQTPPPAAPVPSGQYPKEQTDKKMISGILGIVLGAFGVHKFYLGYQKEGIIMLAVSLVGFLLCGIPTSAVAIIGLVEGILYLTKTDDEFVATYVVGRKPWF